MQQEGRQTGLADVAAAYHPGHQRGPGTPAEFRTEEVDDSRVLGHFEQCARFRRVPRERLLTQDVLSRAHRLRRDRRMGVRRCRDRDRVDTRERERLVQRCRAHRHVEPLGPLEGPPGIASHERADGEARGAQGPNVRETAEAGADDDCIQITHGVPRASLRVVVSRPENG